MKTLKTVEDLVKKVHKLENEIQFEKVLLKEREEALSVDKYYYSKNGSLQKLNYTNEIKHLINVDILNTKNRILNLELQLEQLLKNKI